MCGITGIYAKNKINKIEERIDRMTKCITYRGPDNQATEILSEKIALGHARLSIIDLQESSNQPMYSENKEWIIVFNGEIYNYKEIKEKIKNYKFKTNGDTEVILASVQTKGIEWFLQKANGMFAFALYNLQNKELFLVRDRFSIKPLFYTKSDNEFIFGSEIKSILNSGLIEPKCNYSAIDEYLGNRMVREPFTFFDGIYQVCGGEYLKIDSNLKITKKKYYELPRQNFEKDYNEQKLVNETKRKVEEAINRWTISDVKVGSYLSGGVDSSLTSAIIASNKENRSDLHTYTIGFKNNNEFEYAKIVADKYGVNHKNILINYKDYLKEWDRLIEFNDAPLAVPNEIPLAIMSTDLSKDITVVISGEGADELFGGYGKIYRLPFDYANHNLKGTFYENLVKNYEYVPRELRDKFLKTDMEYRKYFDNKISNEFTNYSNEENVFRFFQTYHIKGLLKRVDMTTMQASVEARPPFLDHELIEFVNTKVPYDLKLKWIDEGNKEVARSEYAKDYSEKRDIPKYILKKVAENYLPDEIIYRKKVGFPVPLSEWMSEISKLAKQYLINADWVYGKRVNDLISETTTNSRAGQILWMFINIEKFKQMYFNKEWRY